MIKGVIGGTLIGFGALLLAHAMIAPSAAPGAETVNLGLLFAKVIEAVVGGAVFIAGFVVLLMIKPSGAQ